MYTICLVEDEMNLNQLIKTYLEKASYKVIQVFNGEDALKYLDSDIHLWILDIMLSDSVSGYDLIKKYVNTIQVFQLYLHQHVIKILIR